ncbi:MAG: SIMPL domain-containing protein [Dehalogenimonas sp.]
MKKGILGALIAIAIFAVGMGIMGFTAAQSGELVNTTQQVGIWVSGEGKVTVVPDVANLSLGVQVESATLADANQKASAAMEALINVLKTQGIADKDIKTQNFNIYPVYDYTKDIGTPVIRGYQVTNTVVVKVRVIANAGKIIDASVAAAGDAVRVNSISFSVDDPTKSIDQARELALLDAKAKAEQIARVTGVSLGSVSYVSDSSSTAARVLPPSFDSKAGAAGSTTPILPGDTDLTVSVQVIYNIK